MSGGGSTSTQTNSISPWMEEAAKTQLGKATALTDTTQNPYQQYGGQRIAEFNPMQQKYFEGMDKLQPSAALSQGVGIAGQAAQQALGTSYDPAQFQNQFQAPGQYNPSQFSNQFQGPGAYQAGQFGDTYDAPAAFEAGQFQNRFQGPGAYQAGQFGAERVSGPQLQQFQMGPAERVRADTFGGRQAAQYMSPYIEQAMEPQLREAQRASEMQRNVDQAQAVSKGAFGGSRQAIVEAERQRNLGTQMGDIRAKGLQSAYEQATQQFNQDAARRLQAQQLNQQAGLTVGGQNLAAQLGTQQLGAQTGLQAALANQQQAMQAQQLAEQSRQFGAGQGLSAAQLQAQYGLSADQAQEASRQFASTQAAQTAAQQAQARQAAQQAFEQSRQFGAGQGMTAAQLQAQYGLSAQQAQEAANQFAAQQAMTGAQSSAQYGLAAQQAREASRQYGAGLGLQGLQTALSGASQLGGLGSTQFGQQKDVLTGLQAAGGQQQALDQAKLSQGYEDFLARQKYPYQQLEFMSNIMRGTPYSSTTSMYSPGPSLGSQLLGAGTALGGAYLMGRPFKKGGAVSDAPVKRENKKSAGLAELALSKI